MSDRHHAVNHLGFVSCVRHVPMQFFCLPYIPFWPFTPQIDERDAQ